MGYNVIDTQQFATNLMAELFGCLTASLAVSRRTGRIHLARSAWLNTADRWLARLHSWYLQSAFYSVLNEIHMT